MCSTYPADTSRKMFFLQEKQKNQNHYMKSCNLCAFIVISYVFVPPEAIFVQLENNHGESLVRRAVGYLTAAEFGLSWSELEDLLSLDDAVMVDVTTYNAIRLWHFPPVLLCRLMRDLEPWLSTAKMDGTWLYRWSHQEFRIAATDRLENQAKGFFEADVHRKNCQQGLI